MDFVPTKAPYDPRHMLSGVQDPTGAWQSGFFDKGSFKEYLAGWGKSVVVGRGRLGGIPMGCIAVETRLVECRVPADRDLFDEPCPGLSQRLATDYLAVAVTCAEHEPRESHE